MVPGGVHCVKRGVDGSSTTRVNSSISERSVIANPTPARLETTSPSGYDAAMKHAIRDQLE